MALMDTAKLLTRIGAILSMLLGTTIIIFYSVELAFWLQSGWFRTFHLVYIGLGIMTVIIGYYVQTRFLPIIDTDPRTIGIYLVILGLLAAFGAWLIGGTLILIGGILALMEGEQAP